MNSSFRTHATDVHGDIHSGSGDINKQYYYYLPAPGSRGPSSRKQPVDELRWLRRRFVEPLGMGKARDILMTSQTVLIEGTPGSGRTATAKMLLWELRDDSKHIHELLLQDHDDGQHIDASHIGERDLIWLDLSKLSETRWREVHDELSSVRATVQELGAYLVIVLPDKTGRLSSTLTQYRAEIQRPPAGEVLYRYLRAEEISRPARLPLLPFLSTSRRMEDVHAYARLILRARDEDRDGDFGSWCEAAYRAFSGQAEDVAAQLAELTTGRQRALLIAVAMLHQAHADVVHRAGGTLLTMVKQPDEEVPLLERAPLDRRLEEIGAELEPSGEVRFKKLGYDAAVRSYLWACMPELRESLQNWVEETADSRDLTSLERKYLVERFTEQCLNERHRQALTSLAEKLTASPTREKMEAASLVLQRGLRDEEHGRFFRRQIYEWSCASAFSDRLAEVITVVCREEMAATHPDEALVRLHHVARRERGTRGREALVDLVGTAPRLRRQMLNRLTDYAPDPRRWPSDVDLFLDIADPEAFTDSRQRRQALLAERRVQRQLTAGWALVFTQRPYATWAPTVARWLHIAAHDDRHRRVLLDVLVRAGHGEANVLARLYAMTRERRLLLPLSTSVFQAINTLNKAQTI